MCHYQRIIINPEVLINFTGPSGYHVSTMFPELLISW